MNTIIGYIPTKKVEEIKVEETKKTKTTKNNNKEKEEAK